MLQYETYDNTSAPDLVADAPVDQFGWQNPRHSQPIPLYSAPYSRFQVPPTPAYAVPPVSLERNRRPTADSYVSDYGQSEASTRHARGRVRFSEPEDSSRRSYSRPSPPRPYDNNNGDGYLSGSDEDDDEYGSAAPTYRSRSRSRSRLMHRRAYQSSYANDSDEDGEEEFDEILGGRVFQFVPSRASRALSKSGHSIDTDVSAEKSETGTINTRDELNGPKTTDILHIFQSQYTGDAVSDGTHTAKLTVVHDPKKQRQPLFRWM